MKAYSTFKLLDVSHMLNELAPEQHFLLQDFLPMVPIAAITGQGGVGKSFVIMKLCCAVAGCDEFLGMKVSSPGTVMYISAEEEGEELHRRFDSIVKKSSQSYDYSGLRSHFKPIELKAGNCSLFYDTEHGIRVTQTYEDLLSYAKTLTDLRLIVIDTYSAISDFDENNRTSTTKALEKLRVFHTETGAMVMLIHHNNKQSSNSKNAPRGSSAFVNSLRWVATLSEHASYYSLSVIKSNYSKESSIQLFPDPLTGCLVRGESIMKEKEGGEINEVSRIVDVFREIQAANGSVNFTNLKNEASLAKSLKMTESRFKELFKMMEFKKVFSRGEKSKLIFDQKAYSQEYSAHKENNSQGSYEEI
ncbi:AAA family ATPase [Marinomonas fungiae]|uniref:AAA domain n=1 Tax=Marinomonas fungiae TaxID=1137284 RepID=A0A0K6IUS6_9GAMM|nr:AAA family ATPase [Marinomonas fungiae]CUB06860.1 AAA domain [Marinomonas fungiae]